MQREAERLAQKENLEPADYVKLEKVTKAYTMLMSDLRESLKAGLFDSFTKSELEEIASSGEQIPEGKQRGRRGRKPASYNKDKL